MNYDLENKSISSTNFPLPGGNNQLDHLLEQKLFKGNRALIIGHTTTLTVKKLFEHYAGVFVISDSYDSLINIRMNLKEIEEVRIKMMDYSHTDFDKNYFDLVFAQGSISSMERKSILKEIKRIISDDGILSVGEIVSLKEPVAGFVKDIWELSGLDPLPSLSVSKFYESKGFVFVGEKDLSGFLKDYYEKLSYTVSKASKEKKDENKKIFTRMKHESNAYLKLGGDKYIGFKSLILRKSN